jgi:hypothetical protein
MGVDYEGSRGGSCSCPTRRLQQVQVQVKLLIAGQGSKSAPYAVRRTRAQVNVVPVRYAGRVCGMSEVLRVDGVPLIFWPRGEERGARSSETRAE